MPTPFAKSVAVFLLVMQVLIALTPGRVLCIPIADCGGHEAGSDSGHHHDELGHCPGHPALPDHFHGHSHGPLELVWHPSDHCGCHVHLPVPSDDQPPSKPRGEAPEVRACFGPSVVVLLVIWKAESPPVVATLQRPPDLGSTGQWRALKVTRLLI